MLRIALMMAAMAACTAGADRGWAAPSKPKAPPKTTPVVFQGTVAMVLNSQLVVATRTERRTFLVAPDARIVVNRAEATLHDVVPGQYASIASSSNNGQLVANFIHATRQY